MPTIDRALEDLDRALAGLRAAAAADGDDHRARVADWVEGLFAGTRHRAEIRTAAARALTLWRGGMGSFQDVGTAVMSEAVGQLREALQRCRSVFLRP